MKKENNKLYSSPKSVMIQVISEQVLAASNLIMMDMNGIDNEEFVAGGTFSDWV